jgi:hypothetical protein
VRRGQIEGKKRSREGNFKGGGLAGRGARGGKAPKGEVKGEEEGALGEGGEGHLRQGRGGKRRWPIYTNQTPTAMPLLEANQMKLATQADCHRC